MFFEAINEVAAERVPAIQPGFVWHPMENSDAGSSDEPNGDRP